MEMRTDRMHGHVISILGRMRTASTVPAPPLSLLDNVGGTGYHMMRTNGEVIGDRQGDDFRLGARRERVDFGVLAQTRRPP